MISVPVADCTNRWTGCLLYVCVACRYLPPGRGKGKGMGKGKGKGQGKGDEAGKGAAGKAGKGNQPSMNHSFN